MAIKIGSHYVSEAANAQAKISMSQLNCNKDMLSALSIKFSNTNFSTNTQPFLANGTNNIAVSPAILQQMLSSREKRAEYEALIYDCNSLQQSFGKTLPNGVKVESQGFIIDAAGILSSWCVTKPSENPSKSALIPLPKNDKNIWQENSAPSPKAILTA